MRNSPNKNPLLWAVVSWTFVFGCVGFVAVRDAEATCPAGNRAACMKTYYCQNRKHKNYSANMCTICNNKTKCPLDYLPDDAIVHVNSGYPRPMPPTSPFVFDGASLPKALLTAAQFDERQNVALQRLQAALASVIAHPVEIRVFDGDYEQFSLKGISPDEVTKLKTAPNVRWASKTERSPSLTPVGSRRPSVNNAPASSDSSIHPWQWGLLNQGDFTLTDVDGGEYTALANIDIDAERAWTVERQIVGTSAGRRQVMVVVIDDGFNLTIPELQMNLYKNPKEIPCDGVDNDRDGLTDNTFGWDAVLKHSCLSEGALREESRHGTHVAGTIAGMPLPNGPNLGWHATGVAPNVVIYPIKAFSPNGPSGPGFYADHLVDAYSHVLSLKNAGYEIAVVNTAFGGPCHSMGEGEKLALESLVKAGITVVGAAGNDRTNTTNSPVCPGNYRSGPLSPLGLEGVISVAASNPGPSSTLGGGVELLKWSNFSDTTVNVAAPGTGIYANGELRSGTSMATAFVSGTVALMKSVCPLLTPKEIESIISDPKNSKRLGFSVASGGLLNAEAAVRTAAQRCLTACVTDAGKPSLGQELQLETLKGKENARSLTGRDGCAFFRNPGSASVTLYRMKEPHSSIVRQSVSAPNSPTSAARVIFETLPPVVDLHRVPAAPTPGF